MGIMECIAYRHKLKTEAEAKANVKAVDSEAANRVVDKQGKSESNKE